jgi:hypothetical protein
VRFGWSFGAGPFRVGRGKSSGSRRRASERRAAESRRAADRRAAARNRATINAAKIKADAMVRAAKIGTADAAPIRTSYTPTYTPPARLLTPEEQTKR